MNQSGQEDTWKTINSIGGCTAKNTAKGTIKNVNLDTLTPK